MKYLTAALFALLLAAPAPADGPVRKLLKKEPPATAGVSPAAPKAPPVVGKPGDRLKAHLQGEIDKLYKIEREKGLTPEQWARLLALIELFLRLAPLFFEPAAG